MSTPTENKTLGQIAYEADGYRNWDIQNKYMHDRWERIAKAVYDVLIPRVLGPTVKQAEPWKLPEPPAGMKWHREDGWTEGMFKNVSKFRPLLSGEVRKAGDMCWKNGMWVLSGDVGSPTFEEHLHYITDRPLPQPADPVGVKAVPYEETDLFHARHALLKEGMRANALEAERDQLRKELEEVHIEMSEARELMPIVRRQDFLEASLKEAVQAQLAFMNERLNYIHELEGRASVLTTENAALKEKLQGWENAASAGHPTPCNLGPLCPYCEIERLRSQFRWTPVSDPSPETEEQSMRREFEEWAEKHDYLHQGSVTIAAKAAWQAALASRNTNA